jgi:hypothetical protein
MGEDLRGWGGGWDDQEDDAATHTEITLLTWIAFFGCPPGMKLNTGFSQYSDSGVADKADEIVKALTGNAKFPAPSPTLASITALTKTLRDAIASTGPGRGLAVLAARGALVAALTALAANLLATPNVTEADLATTGYDLPKPRTLTGAAPDAPKNARVKHSGQTGVVIPQCNAVKGGGVRVYEVQWTLDPNNGPWNDGGSFPNSRAMKLIGLPRAKDVWVRIRVIGTNGPSAWSDPATILVE